MPYWTIKKIQGKFTHCCKCRRRLKIKRGFAERCPCKGELGVMEAMQKLEYHTRDIKVYQTGYSNGASNRQGANSKKSTSNIIGLKNKKRN